MQFLIGLQLLSKSIKIATKLFCWNYGDDFYSFYKSSKSNEATKHLQDTSTYAFQSMKSLDDGIARRYSRNGLVNRVGDFSLLQSYIRIYPLLQKHREYSCALPIIYIPEDIWCERILKYHQNEEVIWIGNFLSAEILLKTHGTLIMLAKTLPTLTPSNSSIFHY